MDVQKLQKILIEIKGSSPEKKRALLEKKVVEENGRLIIPPFFLSSPLDELWLSLVLIGQQHLVMGIPEERVLPLLNTLLEVEQFYACIGGIVGYHLQMLLLMQSQGAISDPSCHYLPPSGIDLSVDSLQIQSYTNIGLDSLPLLAEIYVVGGAADRLRPQDPVTQEALPAALFSFCGHTLLEWLIRDLEAKEYLYKKRHGKSVITPIAMMTSKEKHNHEQILSFCEKRDWFNRGEENIRFFEQPLVPTMDERGKWCKVAQGELLMKPGGHGVLWKLAKDTGIFSWMRGKGRKKVLVRQINNPIAGVDFGLLAFCGIGFSQDKQFGFSSCLRRVSSAEGVNLVIESEKGGKVTRCLTNIEYCDFPKKGIQDVPQEEGSIYSKYPSNTNILFADLDAIEKKLISLPIPGMLVNKKKVSFKVGGKEVEKEVVRLESTMQNLADAFETTEGECAKQPTFLTYHHRYKTISAIKKRHLQGASLLETPEGCLYDWTRNMHELLSCHCQMVVPSLGSEEEFLQNGPPFLFFYHPALGPLFSEIGKKISGGQIEQGGDLKLEIADVKIHNLHLTGSFHVQASSLVSFLCLKDVKIENRGLDREMAGACSQEDFIHHELCKIVIEGDGEFHAEGITFLGPFSIFVRAGIRMTAVEKGGTLLFQEESLDAPGVSATSGR